MSIFESLRIAFRALAANKLRSALTMLGIIIGVAAVVALMAIGNGATADITAQIEGIGTNLLSVTAGSQQRSFRGPNITVPLTWSDYEALAGELQDIRAITPTYSTNMQFTYLGESKNIPVEASLPEWMDIFNEEVEFGRFFTDGENRAGAHVVVLGSQAAQDLFQGQRPLGRAIKINGQTFVAVGVFKESGGGFGSRDDSALMPIETAYRMLGSQAMVNGKRRVSSITASTTTSEVATQVMDQMDKILRRQHALKPYAEADFTITSQEAFLQAVSQITATMTIFLGAIAGISLLVGGIGIMNIMLVSVTERTREIGLRKAVGARKRTILVQFLIETMTLSMLGGSAGIGVGYLIAHGVKTANLINAQVDSASVALAFLFSAAVGVFFGIYPASRAASLRPIEALRYE